jgi:hypothetical protein
VTEVTWPWRTADHGAAAPASDLRRTALVQAVVMGILAACVLYVLGRALAGRLIAGAAILVLLLGFFVPAAYRRVHGFGQAVGRLVGGMLVYVLLVPFFYLVVVPGAIWLRLRGRDPLHRRFRAARYSYWVPRAPQARDQNIDRQFLQEDRTARGALRDVGSLPDRDPGMRP